MKELTPVAGNLSPARSIRILLFLLISDQPGIVVLVQTVGFMGPTLQERGVQAHLAIRPFACQTATESRSANSSSVSPPQRLATLRGPT